ncbi:MAG: hypothetical protein WCP06_01695 [Verrucomicrobiota bacterium]
MHHSLDSGTVTAQISIVFNLFEILRQRSMRNARLAIAGELHHTTGGVRFRKLQHTSRKEHHTVLAASRSYQVKQLWRKLPASSLGLPD